MGKLLHSDFVQFVFVGEIFFDKTSENHSDTV